MCPPHLGLWTTFLYLYFVLARTGVVCIIQIMFQCYFFDFLVLCWYFHDTLYARGSGVPRGPYFHCGVSFCLFLPDLPLVLLFLSCDFLAQKSHPSYRLGFLLCQGCHLFFATDCHIIPQSGIRPDLWVHSFLDFSCHPFYLLFTFLIFVSLFFLPCDPNRSGICISFLGFLSSSLSMSHSYLDHKARKIKRQKLKK